ncbi:flavodoxin family protein [Acidaminobacterium chupaoyuni]
MSVLVIWSSPNENGLTAKCKSAAVGGVLEFNMTCDEIPLNRLSIQRCQVCDSGYGQCAEGSCVLNDEMNRVYKMMAEADGIILVTPVYWHDPSEPMQALLDRVRRCDCKKNHWLKDKKIMLVACAGGSGNGAIHCLETLEMTMKHMGANVRERLPVTRFSQDYMPLAIRAAAWQLCCEIVEENTAG